LKTIFRRIKMRKGSIFFIALSLVILGILILPGCFITKVSPEEANKYFTRAEDRISSIMKQVTPETKAAVLGIIAYDGDSEELVRMSFPLSLIRQLSEAGIDIAEELEELDTEVKEKLSQLELAELEQLPPCLLVKVEDKKNRVLVWLE
jgi:hypothetical protein